MRGDVRAQNALREAMSLFGAARNLQAVLLMDQADQGTQLWPATSERPRPASPELRKALQKARQSGVVGRTDLYAVQDGAQVLQLDFVAPLGSEASGQALVLRLDPSQQLMPLIRKWPSPTSSGETNLWRLDGSHALAQSDFRWRPEAAGRLRLALADGPALISRVLSGELQAGGLLEALDYRGAPVLGVARRIAGSDWILVSKVDRAEVDARALPTLVWIGACMAAAALVLALIRRSRVQGAALRNLRAERAEHEQRMHGLEILLAVADASSDAIFAKDLQGRYLLFNRAAERITGCRQADVLGRDDRAVFNPEVAAMVMARDASVLERGQVDTADETVNTADGALRVFQATKGPLRDAEGRLLGLYGVSRDVTEQRLAQDALVDSELRNRTLLEALSDGVFVAQDRHFVFANPALLSLLGYSMEELSQLPFEAVVAPAWLDRWTERYLQRTSEGPEPERRYELDWLRRDGSIMEIELHATRINYQGRLAVLGVVSDVTAKHQAQRAQRQSAELLQAVEDSLRESGRLYQSMVAALDEGVLTLDRRGLVLACNPAAERLLGCSQQALRGGRQRWRELDLRHADGRPMTVAEMPLARVLKSGHGVHDLVLGARNLQGQALWLRINAEPVLSSKGNEIESVVVSFTDITDSHANQQQLLKLSLAVAQSPASILIADTAGRIEYCNEAFERISGIARSEAIGRLLSELHEDGTAPEQQSTMYEQLLSGTPWMGEFSRRRSDGEPYDEFIRAAPIRQEDGRISHLLLIGEDISESKRQGRELDRHRHHLEELVGLRTLALAQAESFTRLVTDNIPGMVGYWDSDRRCRFANQAYAAWFGREAADMQGRSMDEVIPPDLLALTRARVAAALGGEPQHFELQATNARGQLHALWAHYAPDEREGRIRGFFVLVSDVSEIKQAEAKLQQLNAELIEARDRADAASRAKSAFLANMSHEIRTPMNAILGLSHLLERDSSDPLALERLAKLGGAAHHLLQVINDILDLSKIESGKLVLEERVFSPGDLVARCCSLMGERAQEKRLPLFSELDGLPTLVRGDSTRLSQALLNLLSNAIKFTTQGHVRISGRLLAQDEHQVHLRFEVSDTGIGIAPDLLPRLFSDFEQGDSSTTRRYGGTGLGLAITRHLAEQMGGTVGVDSQPGQGSRFWLEVRLGLASPDAVVSTTLPAMSRHDALQRLCARHAGANILLVEDNPINQDVGAGAAAQCRPRGDFGRRRPPGAGTTGRAGLRPGADGRADAGDGRPAGHAPPAPAAASGRFAGHRHDRQCLCGGPGPVPGGGHERPRGQTGGSGAAL